MFVTMTSALWSVIEAPTTGAAGAFLADSPYGQNGILAGCSVRRRQWLTGHPSRAARNPHRSAISPIPTAPVVPLPETYPDRRKEPRPNPIEAVANMRMKVDRLLPLPES